MTIEHILLAILGAIGAVGGILLIAAGWAMGRGSYRR
ncbi:hypothetical protein SAMN04489806_0507 [Paramicrobacterium humi]|uniref:Uncharacterized protein n=1 Tax=Paramicrobacterium humi TaxID=640635 RepID=A0A1H4J5L2_9MICO|nr:hypothetical protein SAMN04489806_0507 [Microbacterium humi]